MPSADRNSLAQVSSEVIATWADFCDRNAPLYRSCLVEVIGKWMVEHEDSPIVQQWVRDTHDLMADKNRGRPRS